MPRQTTPLRLPFLTVVISVVTALLIGATGGDGALAAERKAKGDADQPVGRPGEFDYHVFSMSWSPAYCGSKGEAAAAIDQCRIDNGLRKGFVTHGLWPQWNNGGYPQFCAVAPEVPSQLVDAMLEIMPSAGLVQHEWRKHGTCSGLNVDDYLADTRAMWERVRMPDELRTPEQGLEMTAEEVRLALLQANSYWLRENFVLECERNRVVELRVCVDKDLNTRPCGANVKDTCGPKARLMAR